MPVDRRRPQARRRALIAAVLLSLGWSQGVLAATSLWKISRGPNALYLGGTIHVLRPRDLPLPPAILDALDRADALGLETDLGKLHGFEFQRQLLSALRYPAGEQLSDHLDPQTLKELAGYCEKTGIQMKFLLGFKPAFTMSTLLTYEMQRLGVQVGGVDLDLYQRAQATGKPLLALESPEQQLAYIADLGIGNESAFIRHIVGEMHQLEAVLDALIEAWRRGDTVALEALVVRPMASAYPRIYQSLLIQRNRNWLPRIEAWLETEPTELVMVGAGHLVGREGLLHSLRQRGYRVEQL